MQIDYRKYVSGEYFEGMTSKEVETALTRDARHEIVLNIVYEKLNEIKDMLKERTHPSL